MVTVSRYAQNYVRDRAQDHMTAEVTIYRHADAIDFSIVTGIATLPPRQSIYVGKARIWTGDSGASMIIGESEIAMLSTNISIPLDAVTIHKDDIIVVDENPPYEVMTGEGFRVMSVNAGGLIGSTQRTQCISLADSATWEGQ
jgi:hypothetical protein